MTDKELIAWQSKTITLLNSRIEGLERINSNQEQMIILLQNRITFLEEQLTNKNK